MNAIMQTINRIQHYLIALAMLYAMSGSMFAQELGYSGVSPVNNSFGGVAVAAPIDGTAAIYWNPATLNWLDKGEFQFGFGRTNPRWYGDESIFYPALGVAWLFCRVNETNTKDNYWDWDGNYRYSPSNHDTSDAVAEYIASLGPRTVRGFHISLVGKQRIFSDKNLGFAMTEMGQRKQRFLLNPTTGEVEGVQIYRVKTIEFTLAVSWWNKRNLSFGISPILSVDEFPNASLPAGGDYTFLGDKRGHVGLGLQLGVFYVAKSDFNFGFSVKSPSWIPRQTYRWENTGDGSFRVRRCDFSQDTPLRFAFGASYTRFKKALIAADVRHYDFGHVHSLYDFSSNGKRRTATSLGVGVQYHILPGVMLRAGYQFTDANCNSFDDLVFNTTLPIQNGHSTYYGLSFGDLDSWDMTFSGSHSFGNQTIHLADGRKLNANPNGSTFWWGLRFRF